MCTYDTFTGDQWRAVATVRRSEGENVIPISKMQVHLSTSYVETQDIHAKAPAFHVNLLGTRHLFLTHTHSHAYIHINKRMRCAMWPVAQIDVLTSLKNVFF